MLPKSPIRLSRNLRSQTTPYPDAGRLLKRAAFLILILLLAGIYFFTRKEQTNQEAAIPRQILGEQQEAPKTEFIIHKIKTGDTLFNLSQKYEVSWQTLAEINNLEEPYVLRVGQEIKIPVEK